MNTQTIFASKKAIAALGSAAKPINVIHIPKDQNPYQFLLIDNLEGHGVKAGFGSFLQYSSFLNFSVLYNYIKNPLVNVIHLHWQHKYLLAGSPIQTVIKSILFLLQIAVVKLLGVKLVWTVHNIKNHENKHQQLELFFSRILGRLANAVIAHCDQSKHVICNVLKIPAGKIVIVPHGHFINAYENEIDHETARLRLNIDCEDFVFLFFGRLRRYKGLEQLVKSFSAVNAPGLRLVIAGKPDDSRTKAFLDQVARQHENITIVDSYISDDDIQVFMNAADVLVLPFLDILTSGTAILGMTFAKPIIAPNIGCVPDILNSNGAFLYDPSDEDGLQLAIESAIKSKNELDKMGEVNLDAAHGLSWRKIALQTKMIYEKC